MSTSTSPEIRPLLVSVRQARVLLGGISNNKFWSLVREYEIELVGSERKRWAVVETIERAVEKMRKQAAPRAFQGQENGNGQPSTPKEIDRR